MPTNSINMVIQGVVLSRRLSMKCPMKTLTKMAAAISVPTPASLSHCAFVRRFWLPLFRDTVSNSVLSYSRQGSPDICAVFNNQFHEPDLTFKISRLPEV